jgi:hypothetical protein
MDHIINDLEPRIYVVDGKVWTIGAKKISMWSKAKCNKVIIKDDDDIDNNIVSDNITTVPISKR